MTTPIEAALLQRIAGNHAEWLRCNREGDIAGSHELAAAIYTILMPGGGLAALLASVQEPADGAERIAELEARIARDKADSDALCSEITTLEQRLAEANQSAMADFLERDMTAIGNSLGLRGKFRDDFGTMQMADAAAKQAKQLAEANARAEVERAANLANAAELHRASALIAKWKENAERAEARADAQLSRLTEIEGRLRDCVAAMETWGSWEDGVPEGGPGNTEHERVGNAYDMARVTLGYADDGKRTERVTGDGWQVAGNVLRDHAPFRIVPDPSTPSANGGESSPKRVYWWEFFGYLGGAFAHGGD